MDNNEILKALFDFQKECKSINLDSEVSFGKTKFKYASLANIVKTIKPVLDRKNLMFFHSTEKDGAVKCHIYHVESGQSMECELLIPNAGDAKAIGANITYAKRYTLSALLGLITEEDKDVQPMEEKKSKLTDDAFKKACERIKAGEQNIMIQCEAHFALTPSQKSQLVNLSMQYGLS
ncbi:hypothetical protein LCGC14_0371180 [marine sediment metagenome]|uniref:Essential recombination function protein n=1 Tax=marine sediment metagenome TaxID=412755 RepID=A0A0F9TND3_9ZZZZ|nr:ERF family protein [Maribacter sp.]HDZ04874.1 hypothetical protein [Maribacter sp.]HEA80839.1 hypothetical protein [Maribacter sp.]